MSCNEKAAPLDEATQGWVQEHLLPGERIEDVERLHGGWTSEVRRLDISGPSGARALVLRSLVHPWFTEHADGLLSREADTLRLLEGSGVPAPKLIGVDAAAQRCLHPSLLMTLLPGTVRLEDEGAEERGDLLARALVRVHRVETGRRFRPRTYEAWTTPETVELPRTAHRELWTRAVDVIRRDPPGHEPCFLHRDFHPGNVLFDGVGSDQRITGVVDWVETSWGPADLDVAHCSTNLALLHGVDAGVSFAERYRDAGGSLAQDPMSQLYWRLLDALAFSPTAENVAEPWRRLGRGDLTDAEVARRLEDYIRALMDRYA